MTVDETEWGGIGSEGIDGDEQTVEQVEPLTPQTTPRQNNPRKRAVNVEGEAEKEAGVMKKKLKKNLPTRVNS